MKVVEDNAREAIRAAVVQRGWSLAQCVAHLAAVGLETNRPTVHRFLTDDGRRLGLDEFTAWAAALSLPPLDLLSPVAGKARERARAQAIREWLSGREPLDVVPEPGRYRAAVLGRTWQPSEFAVALRQWADAFDAATPADRPSVALSIMDYASGTLRALLRHGGRTRGTALVDREQEG